MTVLEATAALDRLVADTSEGRLLPGVRRIVLRIEGPAWSTPWSTAASTHPADGDGVDADVAFRIASVTKLVTAAAVLALVDQGRCRLDDEVGHFLDGPLLDQFRDRDGRRYAARLTLRQLLDHSSGLPNYFTAPAVLEAVVNGQGRRRFTPRDLLALAAEAEPERPMSTSATSYTDTGFVLAGLIIELVTGMPLEQAYRELVLDPAGMADTWLESGNEAPRRAFITPFELDGNDIADMDPTVDWAGGGLVSTAADLAHLLSALAQGELVSPSAWMAMTRWRAGPSGYYDDYGLGVGRYRVPPVTFIGHHGVWGAFAFWSPEVDLTAVGTVNTARADRRPLLHALVSALEIGA